MAGKSGRRSLWILIGLIAGLIYGILSIELGADPSFAKHWISPFGELFLNLLTMVAVPLVLASIITGIAGLADVQKLSRLGGRTIVLYMVTTAIAITVGLALVNLIQPGKMIPAETRDQILEATAANSAAKLETIGQTVAEVEGQGPLDFLTELIPSNLFGAVGDNRRMLQVVVFAVLFGAALVAVPRQKVQSVVDFFDGVNTILIKLIEYIMWIAPFCVFALVGGLLAQLESMDVLWALGSYSLTVLGGLLLMMLVIYPLFFVTLANGQLKRFFRAMPPIWLLGFSTSSSSATLPVTMRVCEEKLGVPSQVSSFVLPLGATINMDGTSLYQGVAAVFIAQVYGIELGLAGQLGILFTALLASIGTAAVPSAGLIMLTIILKSAGIPEAGLILILAPDRLLDMCRTVVNVTGDAMVASVVAGKERTPPTP